jgi:hypothetical protein
MALEMDIASTPPNDLNDCGHLVKFFESVNLRGMEPHDELAFGGTQYVLAQPGQRYVIYASHSTGCLGLRRMQAGNYAFRWFDCTSGETTRKETVTIGQGDQVWDVPNGLGREVAASIHRLGD